MLRKRRTERARRDEVHAHAALEKSRSALAEARQAVDDFREATKNLEWDLLQRLLGHAVSINDLLDIEVQLKAAQKKAQELVDRVEVCKNTEQEDVQRLEQQRSRRIAASLKQNKSEELETEFATQRQRELTFAEDALMDEFSEIAFNRQQQGD
ncbi:type III secretion system stalk subunit SctO [Martelella alba]|nr:YscO family type III secretion system apparatus protein [Martelella alba]